MTTQDESATGSAQFNAQPDNGCTDKVIMIVEDEQGVRKLVEKILGREGYRVIAMADPRKALVAEQLSSVDLIVTDVIMPGMTGPEMVHQIHEMHPDIKVLFITGYAEDDTLRLTHPYDVLLKPFSREDLVMKVQQAQMRTPRI